MRFRPSLWPTLLTLPTLVVLAGFGSWQLQRLDWKETLIAEREAGMAAAAINLPATAELASFVHRRVAVAGSFLHDSELSFGARVHEGVSGIEILTPLRLEDGRIVLVNRGWVPLKLADRSRRPESLDRGRVAVAGVLRPAQHSTGWLGPRNDAAAGHWFFYEVAAMARHLGLDLPPVVIEALPSSDPARLPVGRMPATSLTSHHLQYAITWYALALVLAAIYLIYHLRREES